MTNSTTNAASKGIPYGSFIRVRKDHPDEWTRVNRGDKDGMVTQDFGRDGLALIFGYDRHNQAQRCQCVGPEMWELWELDFETLDRYEDDESIS